MARRPGRGFKFKPSFRETLRANNAADRFYATMAGMEPRAQSVIAPKRKYTKHEYAETEAPVIDAIGDLLWKHPRILFAVRQNSGMAGYVSFFKIVRQPEGVKVKMPDYWGILIDKRLIAIECKRPTWNGVSNEREESQAAFLGMVRDIGGIGIFACSVDDVANALNG